MATTDIEKKSLEAHVELCAERYMNLENKLSTLSDRLEKLELYLLEIRDKISNSNNEHNKTLITVGTSIFVALLTAVLAFAVHQATK